MLTGIVKSKVINIAKLLLIEILKHINIFYIDE